jgi:hypothetical protein
MKRIYLKHCRVDPSKAGDILLHRTDNLPLMRVRALRRSVRIALHGEAFRHYTHRELLSAFSSWILWKHREVSWFESGHFDPTEIREFIIRRCAHWRLKHRRRSA